MTSERPIPERVESLTPFLVMDILDRAKELEAGGEDIVHFEVGEPDFETPSCVKKAAVQAIESGETRYAPSLGLRSLREMIAERYRVKYGVSVPVERIIVTSGSSPALQMIFATLVESGDEVIMTDPHYACYANFVNFFGGTPVFVETREEENFRLIPDEIEKKITSKTTAILINSPANPTGALMPEEDMEAITGMGVPVVSDEIYHGLVYEGKERSILEFSDQSFVVDGFSKRYAMTGWRVGYCVLPERYVRPFQRLLQSFYISAPTISQYGAMAALQEGEKDLEEMRNAFRERRDFLLSALEGIGLKVASKPAGAFYLLVNVSDYTKDSLGFAKDLLEKGKVATTPGVDFGAGGEGFLRLSYVASIERLDEGVRRIEDYLKEYRS